jgi:hypothetical protein
VCFTVSFEYVTPCILVDMYEVLEGNFLHLEVKVDGVLTS